MRLADADGLDAIDASTGFVSVLARSYWTTSSTFWTNWVPSKTATASDSKDGPEVQKGGAAQRLRVANLTTQASRKVYTCAVDATTGAPACVGDALLSATPFNTTTLNPANRGHAGGVQLSGGLDGADNAATTDIGDLIAWARGTDNLGNEFGSRRHDDGTADHPRRRAAFAPGRPQLWRFAPARGRVSTVPTTACCARSRASRPAPGRATNCGRSSPRKPWGS